MTYRIPIHVGDRVALAPHTDLWMAGCRFGTVTSIGPKVPGTGKPFYFVDLDTGRNVTLDEGDLLGAVGDHRPAWAQGPSASPSSTEGHNLVVTITNAPGDEGCQYTLTLPDGRQATIGDAQDAYSELAGIIDDAFEVDETVCSHADCGYGECSWLQEGPVKGMCQTHGNREGRCQQPYGLPKNWG